jgi:hypothetical protein
MIGSATSGEAQQHRDVAVLEGPLDRIFVPRYFQKIIFKESFLNRRSRIGRAG